MTSPLELWAVVRDADYKVMFTHENRGEVQRFAKRLNDYWEKEMCHVVEFREVPSPFMLKEAVIGEQEKGE